MYTLRQTTRTPTSIFLNINRQLLVFSFQKLMRSLIGFKRDREALEGHNDWTVLYKGESVLIFPQRGIMRYATNFSEENQ